MIKPLKLKDALDFIIGTSDWTTRTLIYEWVLENTDKREIILSNSPVVLARIGKTDTRIRDFVQNTVDTFGRFTPQKNDDGICGAYKSLTVIF
jgi:hypothetical protein